jgi:hypothetical protein
VTGIDYDKRRVDQARARREAFDAIEKIATDPTHPKYHHANALLIDLVVRSRSHPFFPTGIPVMTSTGERHHRSGDLALATEAEYDGWGEDE